MENTAGRRFVQDNVRSDIRELALKLPSDVSFDPKIALQLIDCYSRASSKIPTWSENLLAMDRRSLEQSSSERVARYRASILSGDRLLDLTGGLGVDDTYLSSSFSEVESLDSDLNVVEMASYNDGVLEIENITRNCDDAENWASYKIDNSTTVYVDPDRRDDNGKRLYSLMDCSPPILDWLGELLPKCERLVIKASPMLDLTQIQRDVPDLEQIHVVSDSGEIKEIMLILTNGHDDDPEILAVELKEDQVEAISSNDLDPNPSFSGTVTEENYLFEPAPSILKAGLAERYASSLQLQQAGKNPAFYFSENPVENGSGRLWKVIDVLPLQWKQIRKYLETEGINRANIVRKYFSGSTATILKKLKLKEGGEEYLIFLERHDGSKVCIRAQRLNS